MDINLKKNMINNMIAPVVKNGLCTGCGTCIALCPEKCIELVKDTSKGIYVAKLHKDKCVMCGICLEVCPGHEVDFKQLNINIFGKEPENILIGNYLNCYSGYSNDYDLRYKSSSGGLVTQLLIFALNEGIINGVLVTRMKKDYPLEPEPFIARTKEEIMEASKSKYCPVPANIALKDILDSHEDEKFAVVGLPCHIHGIRKAEELNKKLKNKIVLHLGLFCHHSPNFFATKHLLQRVKVNPSDVIQLNYRGDGWPGFVKLHHKNNELSLPNYVGFVGMHFFCPTRCLKCSDGVCELADISFGDAWLPEFSDDKIGTSLIISKSERGEKIVDMMMHRNVIKLEKINVERVVLSQIEVLHSKKKNITACKIFFKNIPRYNNLLKIDIIDYFFIPYLFLSAYISSNILLRRILSHMPIKFMWSYGILYTYIRHKKAKYDFRNYLKFHKATKKKW